MTFRTTSEPPTMGGDGDVATTPDLSTTLEEPQATGGDTESSAEAAEQAIAGGLPGTKWLDMAQNAYDASQTWWQASVERGIIRNYAHFQSRHAPGSKYLTDYYRLRSQTFRPKTRSMVMRSEAALAVALFSTADLLDAEAYDDTSPDQQDAAEVIQAIVQYRMERTLLWYQTALGALQEADVTGFVVAHVHWHYRSRPRQELYTDPETGAVEWHTTRETLEDEPRADLIPLENVRLDPGADWRDPINRSPYLFLRMPMYVGEIKQMAAERNAEFGEEWYFDIGDAAYWRAGTNTVDPVKRARDGGQLDANDIQRGVVDYEMVWVTRCFMRVDGTDYVYDLLDLDRLLSIPRPVEEVYPHLPLCKRPIVGGSTVLEAHKVIPISKVGMVDETQREINELANLTQDGIRMAVLNRWIARRGAALDMETLKYGAANSVITADDINLDVKELRAADIPATMFAHTDRVSTMFDELAGNFAQSTVVNNRNMNDTVGGMELLQGDAGAVREYEIRTFVETWVNPVIQQLIWLEQTYETDEDLLNEICTRTGLTLDRVIQVLGEKLRVQANVGFGATSPEQRIKRIQLGVSTVTELAPESGMNFNVPEIVKEVFGALGFKNGARFYSPQTSTMDPQMQQLAQENAQLKAQLAGQQAQAQSRVQAATVTAQARLQHAAMDAQTRRMIAQLQANLRAQELQLQGIDRQLASASLQINQGQLANERDALVNEIQVERVKLMAELAKIGHDNRAQAENQVLKDRGGMPASADPSRAGEIARGKFGLIPFQAG